MVLVSLSSSSVPDGRGQYMKRKDVCIQRRLRDSSRLKPAPPWQQTRSRLQWQTYPSSKH